MLKNINAPWHKTSWDRFVQDGLPTLLSERLPLAGYQVVPGEEYTCTLKVMLPGKDGEVEIVYQNVPQPDEDGLFKVEGCYKVVVPFPTEVDLARADILCVGEQILDYLSERLGDAPENFTWDETLAREWLPLDGWIREFLLTEPTSQFLQRNNWLDMQTHVRRINLVPILGLSDGTGHYYAPGEQGRVCPFTTPEGPNIARILEIAQGAEIRDGKLVILENTPAKNLGRVAATIPFLEHNDTNRLLMGVNMMRQWVGAPGPDMPRDDQGYWYDYQNRFAGGPEREPALVQTGTEPDEPDFWNGYNLLTAYLTWDGNAFEDAIVISESAAKKMAHPQGVESGDKISNRYGLKGVVSQILPDDKMPHLQDGTPEELIVSLSNLPSRMNPGQIREAIMGRIARAEGQPVCVPPFEAPSEEELRERLKRNGLPEGGMEVLTVDGKPLARPSTVGWVYWGRTIHLASDKIHFGVTPGEGCPVLGEGEYMVLREHGALETIRALFNTQSVNREDADTLAERVAAGPVEPADSPTPGFVVLSEKLAAGSVRADLVRDRVRFEMNDSPGVQLTQPIQHPWFPLQRVQSIGKNGASAEFEALEEANNRWGRMLETGAPEALVGKAKAQLEDRVKAYFEQLVRPEDLYFNERVLFSGRSVIVSGYECRYDQAGVPEEMAWALFGPLAAREIGMKAVEKRDGKAAKALDAAMAGSWVVAYRAPAYSPRPFLAFRPVRCEGNAIRLSGAACKMMNADFDGDQVALFLPLTEEAQKEAEQCLTIAAHLNTSSELLHHVLPKHDALFGLASLSLTDDGLQEIVSAAGTNIERNWRFLSDRILETALRPVLNQEGAEVTLEACDRLTRLGYDAAQREGASMNPFLGSTCDLPSAPEDDDLDQWRAFKDETVAWLSDYGSVEDNDLGPIFLLFESGARANQNQVVQYLAGGLLIDAEGKLFIQRQGWQKGLTPKELFTRVIGARKGLVNMMSEMVELNQDLETRTAPPGHHVLARARRARQPGVVFARAASNKEHDPLTDLHSRLFVGLPAG